MSSKAKRRLRLTNRRKSPGAKAHVAEGTPFRGHALTVEIDREADRRGISRAEVGRMCEISQAYFQMLMNGDRAWASLGKEAMRQIASFLQVTPAKAMILAGDLEDRDFFSDESIDRKLHAVYRSLRESPLDATLFVPPQSDWEQTPRSVRVLVAALFDRLEGKDFLRELGASNPSARQPKSGADGRAK